MLVKKIPIFQGFPDLCTVKLLSKSKTELSEFRPIFFDIETTGLSRFTSFLYLIGAVKWEENSWFLYQWMAEKPQEESIVLETFSRFLKGASCTVQYNGNRFDQPYLEERFRQNEIDSPFGEIPAIDIYQLLKPYQSLLKLSRMKQPDMEEFMHLPGRRYCDGGKCIRLYRSYMKKTEESVAETLMGHNQEDLLGLGQILNLLKYRCFFQSEFEIKKINCHEQELTICLDLPYEVPIAFSNSVPEMYLTVSGQEARLLIHLKDGKLKQHYSNYKDYEYIPGEDMAITKALSRYMDKSLKRPATLENCYTWFECNEVFLADKQKQKQYLEHTFTYFLNMLKKTWNSKK